MQDRLALPSNSCSFKVVVKGTSRDGNLRAAYGLETKWTSPLSLFGALCPVPRA